MSSSTAQPPANDPAAKGTNKKKPIGSWFMKKFGRRPSVAEGCYDADGQGGTANGTAGTGTGSTTGTRRGSKTGGGCGGGGTTRSKRGDSQQQTLSPLEREGSFGGHSGEGLANTLMLPNTSSVVPSSPPQIEGLPVHDPIAPIELSTGPPLNAAATTTTTPGTGALGPAQGVVTANGQQSTLPSTTTPAPTSNPAQIAASTDTSAAALGGEAGPLPSSAIPVGERVVTGAGATGPTIVSASDADALSPSCDPQGRARSASSDSSSPSRSRSGTSFDMDSEQGYDGRERDSLGNRTMDTGKSRASTKPTTLMSLDTREQGAPQGERRCVLALRTFSLLISIY